MMLGVTTLWKKDVVTGIVQVYVLFYFTKFYLRQEGIANQRIFVMLKSASLPQSNIDLQNVVAEQNKLRKLWRLMTDYQRSYIIATISLGLAAGANTATFLLLRYFIDDYLGETVGAINLAVILAGFVSLGPGSSLLHLSKSQACSTDGRRGDSKPSQLSL